jgi:hypothetical protein
MVTITALALFFIAGASAVHETGAFELDGNATSADAASPFGPADDWDRVCHQVSPTACPSPVTDTTGAAAVSWVAEPTDTTIFTGGGSKDPQDINQWAYKDGSVPDKDNLRHGFAARYSLTPSATCPSGTAATCDVLFFGSDRFDNSGDAQQGFWFFQNAIGLGTNSVGGGSGFTGVHKNGDVLVISDFSVGGTTSTITVYQWNSACTKAGQVLPAPPAGSGNTCGDQNLEQLESSTSAKCSSSLPGSDAFCGLVNTSNITMPWSFLDKTGTAGNGALNGEFYEGGINLSTLGLSGECFAALASETRSSTSTTATLKDFVLGGFGHCESGTATTPTAGADGADSITTAGSVSEGDTAVVTVSGASGFGGNVKFYLCGPTPLTDASYTLCTTNGTQVGPVAGEPVSGSSPVTVHSATVDVTSVGRYCWRADYSGDASKSVPPSSDSRVSECFRITPVQPVISTSATASVTLGSAIDDTAHLTGTANQPGSPVIHPTTAGGAAGGSITFTLYGPSATAVCTTAIATRVVPVSGDGFYSASAGDGLASAVGSRTPTSVGTYYWVASYGGNSPNTLGANSGCGDTGESSVVTDTSSASSAQTWRPNDTATFHTGSGATLDQSTLSGTITIQLYEGLNCVAASAVSGQLYTDGPFTNATAPRSFSTSNTTYDVTVSKSVSWLVKFTPATGSPVTGSQHCENSTLTIAN